MRIDELMEKLEQMREIHGNCYVALETSDDFVDIGGLKHFKFDGYDYVELTKG